MQGAGIVAACLGTQHGACPEQTKLMGRVFSLATTAQPSLPLTAHRLDQAEVWLAKCADAEGPQETCS